MAIEQKSNWMEDNMTEKQQDKKTTGQKDNRIMWASRAHGMT